MRRARLLGTVAGLVVAISAVMGCGISPQPEPPLIEREQLQLTYDGASLTLSGGAGAVSPPEATLTVISLDTPDPEMVITPNPDGSFAALPFPVLVMMPPPEIRVFATAPDGTRSEPLDLVGAPDGSAMPAPRPLEDCLEVPPTLLMGEVAADDIVVGQARVQNDCTDAVILEFVVARQMTDFVPSLGSRAMLATVLAGSSRNIAVTFEPAGGDVGPREDIVFVQVSGMAGITGRRLFTVRGEVVP